MWDLIVSVPDHCLSFYFRWAPCIVALSQNVYKCPILSMYIKFYIQVVMDPGSFILLWQICLY